MLSSNLHFILKVQSTMYLRKSLCSIQTELYSKESKIDLLFFFLSYRKPGPTPTKQRNTKYWSEKYPETSTQISRQEVKLQEAIFELSTGEEDLVQDMNLLRKTYAETMVRFKILNQAEADLVFGKLYPIIPLHNSLACALSR